jgi:hypothetical protein
MSSSPHRPHTPRLIPPAGGGGMLGAGVGCGVAGVFAETAAASPVSLLWTVASRSVMAAASSARRRSMHAGKA